jgi:thiamine biosynthesis lipoprotein
LLFELAQFALAVAQETSGAFDPTVGKTMQERGFNRHYRTGELLDVSSPTAAVTAEPVSFRDVNLDADRKTITLLRPLTLDFGAIAKGFAVEIAADILRRRGLSGFIDAGGNQYLLGTPPGKRAWTVGIKNPDKPGRVIGVVETGEISVSTSADDANFLVADGRKYGHILDPHTLEPSSAALSVTILSRDGTLADAMSKAAFILGPKAGMALVDQFPAMSAIIAYRKPDGTIGVAVSKRLAGSYRPTAR